MNIFIFLYFYFLLEHVQEQLGNNASSDYGSNFEEISLDSSSDNLLEALDVLKSVVIQLPNANRDSMAFLFLHLRHVIDANPVTKMDAYSLATIFAPTIIGEGSQHSNIRTSIISNGGSMDNKLGNVNPATLKMIEKQKIVVKSLLVLSKHFWTGILKDPNYCPFGKFY